MSISAQKVRETRDLLLVSIVDPIVSNHLRWADMPSEKQNALKQFRTDLLNVPQQAGFPDNVTWPPAPD